MNVGALAAGMIASQLLIQSSARRLRELGEDERRLAEMRAEAEPEPGSFDARVKAARVQRHNRELFDRHRQNLMDRIASSYEDEPPKRDPYRGSIRARKLTWRERFRIFLAGFR